MDVSDRRGHAQLTQEAKIASDFYFIREIFAVAGFAGALGLVKGEADTSQSKNRSAASGGGGEPPFASLSKILF